MKRAVFIDKDGTLVENVPYNVAPKKMHFAPGVAEGLRFLADLQYDFYVVSNQSGVARGYFGQDALVGVEQQLRSMFDRIDVPLHGFYYCPHHPEGMIPKYAVACSCRKPAPGLLLSAARENGIDLKHSWMIGDILDDVEAGRRAGCRTILVENGNEHEWQLSPLRTPHYVVSNFAQAAHKILQVELSDIGFILQPVFEFQK